MSAEDGVTITEAQIGNTALPGEPPRWHDEVYGVQFPAAEHFGTVESALSKLHAVSSEHRAALLDGSITPEAAQEFAGRVARLELGLRGFARSAGVSPSMALSEVTVGRAEKYTARWEEAIAAIQADRGTDEEPTVQEIKDKCREMWGKGQFTLTQEQNLALADGRRLYREARAKGADHQVAVEEAIGELLVNGETVIINYKTPSGTLRQMRLADYIDSDVDLEGIVDSSRAFEKLTEQDMASSLAQYEGELAEVIELRSFFDLVPGSTPSEPADIALKFDSIDAFRSHVDEEHLAGKISEGEFNRYLQLESLDELREYIEGHLAYEGFDVLLAATGILHRIPADIRAAKEDALADRAVYEEIVPAMQDEVGPVTPGFANTVKRIMEEQGLRDWDPKRAAAYVAALTQGVLGFLQSHPPRA